MTERERYRTRGLYYMITEDYQACEKEYADLVGRFPADVSARNNLAQCQTHLRELWKAVSEMKAVVQINPREAVKVFTEANRMVDTWIGHFDLGRAYLAARAYPRADSEFDRCIKRRGEALSSTAAFAESYKFYSSTREHAGEDPLLAEIRRRLGR